MYEIIPVLTVIGQMNFLTIVSCPHGASNLKRLSGPNIRNREETISAQESNGMYEGRELYGNNQNRPISVTFRALHQRSPHFAALTVFLAEPLLSGV